MKKNILILYSIKDRPIEERIDLLNNDPRLKNYDLNYQYLQDFCTGENSHEDRVLNAIKKFEGIIEEIQPNIILIHTGKVMHEHRHFFIIMFNELYKKYPHIIFGIERIERFLVKVNRYEKHFYQNFRGTEELQLLMKFFF